jgi:hypothetical protein
MKAKFQTEPIFSPHGPLDKTRCGHISRPLRVKRERSRRPRAPARAHLPATPPSLLTAAILAIVLAAVVAPISLVLLLVTVFAWRGCPTCWTVGLLGTLADHDIRRDCSRC